MKNHGLDIIDVHHHYEAGYRIAEFLDVTNDAKAPEQKPASDADLPTRLAIMDMEGVWSAIVLAGHTYLRPNGIADTQAVNDAVAEYISRDRTRLVAGVGVVEPLYGEVGLAEIRR